MKDIGDTPINLVRMDNTVAIVFELPDAYGAMTLYDYLTAMMHSGKGFKITMNGVIPCEDLGDTPK